jgi:hypothetical protein
MSQKIVFVTGIPELTASLQIKLHWDAFYKIMMIVTVIGFTGCCGKVNNVLDLVNEIWEVTVIWDNLDSLLLIHVILFTPAVKNNISVYRCQNYKVCETNARLHFNLSHCILSCLVLQFLFLTHTHTHTHLQRLAKNKPFRHWSVFVLMLMENTEVLLISRSTEVWLNTWELEVK